MTAGLERAAPACAAARMRALAEFSRKTPGKQACKSLSRLALIGQQGVLMIQFLAVIRRPSHIRQNSLGGQPSGETI
jgi:hypothetical protein